MRMAWALFGVKVLKPPRPTFLQFFRKGVLLRKEKKCQLAIIGTRVPIIVPPDNYF